MTVAMTTTPWMKDEDDDSEDAEADGIWRSAPH